jgi:hypothetical protein
VKENDFLEIIKRQKQTIEYYEKGIAEGTIITLPCPMGMDMWFVFKHNSKWKVRKTYLCWENAERAIRGFGVTFFLTEEQANDKKDELNGSINVVYFRSN